MAAVLRVVGYVLIIFGLVWAFALTRGYLSGAEGFTNLVSLLPWFGFHAVCTWLGTFMVAKAGQPKHMQKAA